MSVHLCRIFYSSCYGKDSLHAVKQLEDLYESGSTIAGPSDETYQVEATPDRQQLRSGYNVSSVRSTVEASMSLQLTDGCSTRPQNKDQKYLARERDYAPRPVSNYRGGDPRSSGRVSYHSEYRSSAPRVSAPRASAQRVSRDYTRTSRTYVR